MKQDKITEGLIYDINKLYDLLYPDSKKNFRISAKIVAFIIVNNRPTQARKIARKFLEIYSYQFQLIRDLDDTFNKMANDFIVVLREHIHEIHSYESPWYKALKEWDKNELQKMDEEAHYNDEIPVYSVKDVEKKTGKSRQSVYNYIDKLKIPKYGDGQNAFKKRDYLKLIKAMGSKS